MNDPDTAIRAALAADADLVPDTIHKWDGPLVTIGSLPQPPTRWPRVAVVAVAAVVLVAGLWVVALRGGNHGRLRPVGIGTPSAAQPLLFPPNAAPVGGPVEETPGRYTALLSAPSGAIFTIDLLENSWGTLPTGTPTRSVNGQLFEAVASNSYAMLEPCSITITKGPSGANTWNDETLALLYAQSTNRGEATVSLPVGWAVLEAPAQLVTGYLYSVEHGVSDETTSLWVAPATGMSAIYGIYGPPQSTHRADFDGHRAWFSIYPTSTGPTNNHLTWETAGNAYDITARGATVEQLVAFARTLVPASISDLAGNSQRAGVAQPPATIATTTPVAPGACTTRALKVEQAP